MKKFFFFLLAFSLIGIECFAQTLKPILKRGIHTDANMILFLNDTSKKAVQFRNYFLASIQDLLKDTLNLPKKNPEKWIYQHMLHKKVTLKAKEWKNSGWDPTNQKIQTFLLKKDWTGWVAEFAIGSYKRISYKDSCVNLLFKVTKENPNPDKEFEDYKPDPVKKNLNGSKKNTTNGVKNKNTPPNGTNYLPTFTRGGAKKNISSRYIEIEENNFHKRQSVSRTCVYYSTYHR